MPGRLVVRLGPQERHQALPRLWSGRFGEREVEQEGEQFGLGDAHGGCAAVARLDRQRPENPEIDHGFVSKDGAIEEKTA